MKPVFNSHYQKAIALLQGLCTPNGILASSIQADNYKRIWARDAVVSGLAGLLEGDAVIMEGLGRSLDLLAQHQHPLGMIPSNVDPRDGSVSYGSLVGRVDTGCWYVVGACLYYKNTSDESFWQRHLPSLQKARNYLQGITFNDRGWIYTPLSGNWADEYPVHGYTLYDNSIYLWGEQLWASIIGPGDHSVEQLKKRMLHNFWPGEAQNELTYQATSYSEAAKKQPKHFASFILPGTYDLRFDAAANGLGLLLLSPSAEQMSAMADFVLSKLTTDLGEALIPAFWPPIKPDSPDWHLLQHNYSYDFKNRPGSFHNGGIWPVWMGLFCLGLAVRNQTETGLQIVSSYSKLLEQYGDAHFSEYYRSDDLQPDGKQQMGYTASGAVFMQHALSKGRENINHILGLV